MVTRIADLDVFGLVALEHSDDHIGGNGGPSNLLRVGLIRTERPSYCLVTGTAVLLMPGDQPIPAHLLWGSQEPHRIQEGTNPAPGLDGQQQIVSLGDNQGNFPWYRYRARHGFLDFPAKLRRIHRCAAGEVGTVAPQPDQQVDVPDRVKRLWCARLRSTRSRRSSSRCVRWNPSMATSALPPNASTSCWLSVDFQHRAARRHRATAAAWPDFGARHQL